MGEVLDWNIRVALGDGVDIQARDDGFGGRGRATGSASLPRQRIFHDPHIRPTNGRQMIIRLDIDALFNSRGQIVRKLRRQCVGHVSDQPGVGALPITLDVWVHPWKWASHVRSTSDPVDF